MGAGASHSPVLIAEQERRINKTESASAQVSLAQAVVAASATRTQAEASRAQAEMASFRRRAAIEYFPTLACCALLAGLALDVYLHESPTHIRRRMLRTLRAARPPFLQCPTALLPVPQRPIALHFLPCLLMGPSGCGKTALLGSIVAGLPKATPTVVVRLRLPSESWQAPGAAGAATPDWGAPALMDMAAHQIFSQVGFPLRSSLISSAISHGFALRGGPAQAERICLMDTGSRVVLALSTLFDVCEELQRERQRTMSPLDAAPVLLFDGVRDLVKDARLARSGGRLILSALGTLLVAYGVDRKAVRAVVAGSSAEVAFALEECSALRGPRWECYSLLDPEEGATRSALEARGYSAGEAQGMVSLCGTRLRLLEQPLLQGAAACSYADFMRSANDMGSAAFASVFARLGKDDAAALGRMLDAIEACEAASEGSAGAAAVAAAGSAAPARAPALWRPRKEQLPSSLQNACMAASILYVNLERELFFQSLLHRRVWAQKRGAFLP